MQGSTSPSKNALRWISGGPQPCHVTRSRTRPSALCAPRCADRDPFRAAASARASWNPSHGSTRFPPSVLRLESEKARSRAFGGDSRALGRDLLRGASSGRASPASGSTAPTRAASARPRLSTTAAAPRGGRGAPSSVLRSQGWLTASSESRCLCSIAVAPMRLVTASSTGWLQQRSLGRRKSRKEIRSSPHECRFRSLHHSALQPARAWRRRQWPRASAF
jgi:hypothetical protein